MKTTFASFVSVMTHSEGGDCSVHGNTGIDSICEVATVQKSNLLKYY